MITRAIIAVAAAFLFALTVGILTANLAESGNGHNRHACVAILAASFPHVAACPMSHTV